MTAPGTTRPADLPRPRTAADGRPRRVRPPNEYWDVFSASWVRTGAAVSRGAGVSSGAGAGG
jgi:hypothetical protein